MPKNPPPIILSDAKLQDSAVAGINAKLSERLEWLTTAYGIIVKKPNEKGLYPAIETSVKDSAEYLSMLPDSHLGNYSYWDVMDGASMEKKGDFIWLKFQAGLVFWGDLRNVYGTNDWKLRNTLNVLSDVADAIRMENFGTSRIKTLKQWTESTNIYKGYYIKEVNNQHLMRPYFGFRIECEIINTQPCK